VTAALLDPLDVLQQHTVISIYDGVPDETVHTPGQVRLEQLRQWFSARRIAVAFASTRCSLCGQRTTLLSFLACARQCERCFSCRPEAALCDLDYAKVLRNTNTFSVVVLTF
jgi:hypothetical protein